MDLSDYRKEYNSNHISNSKYKNPIVWFDHWMKDAIESTDSEPTAMVISTVSEQNQPSSRVVLLKGFSDDGFIFYTNYTSRKGQQISNNNAISAVFFWPATERQVRIEGEAIKVSDKLSDEYFYSRPLESRINAIISPQSKPIASREILEQKHTELMQLSDKKSLLRPNNWGGYCIKPRIIEFWQGRPGRLHDRIQFRKTDNGWESERLAP